MLHVYTNQSKETVRLEIAVGSSTMSVSHTIKYKCKAAPVLFKHTSRIKTNLYFAFKISPLFLSYMYIVVFCNTSVVLVIHVYCCILQYLRCSCHTYILLYFVIPPLFFSYMCIVVLCVFI